VTPRPGPKTVITDSKKTFLDDDAATTATGISTLTSGSGASKSQQGTVSSRLGTFIKNPSQFNPPRLASTWN